MPLLHFAKPASQQNRQRGKGCDRPIGIGFAEKGLDDYQGEHWCAHPGKPTCFVIAPVLYSGDDHKQEYNRPSNHKLPAYKLPNTCHRSSLVADVGIIAKVPKRRKLICKIPDDVGAGGQTKRNQGDSKITSIK